MNALRVLTLAESDEWRQAWRRLPLPQQDVFLRPEYYKASAPLGAKVECAVYEEEGSLILYPYLRRPIPSMPRLAFGTPGFDLEVAYGYGGPAGNTRLEGVWHRFFEAFTRYCRSVGVVAEFIRLHPLNADHELLSNQYELSTVNQNVVVDLERTSDEIWRSYRHSARKNVNKALRSGVEVFSERVPAAHFSDYLRIYAATMERRQAKGFYAFPKSFYDALHALMPEAVVYFFARWRGEIVSCELCLLSETMIYSFLGGTLNSAYEVRPNNLLKHEVVRWSRELGLQKYVLGGGSQPGDGILEYKKTFAPGGVVDFQVAKRIHDSETYARLIRECEETLDPKANNRWFLRWRYDL
jgi:hypothetical protein